MRRLLIDLVAFALCAIAAGGCLMYAAPAPVFRSRPRRVLATCDLCGTWRCTWGGTRCTMTFSHDGCYRCDWCGTRYVGSWCCRGGVLRITESCRPELPCSWQSYAVKLGADLSGPVVEGAAGVSVRLERAGR